MREYTGIGKVYRLGNLIEVGLPILIKPDENIIYILNRQLMECNLTTKREKPINIQLL